MVREELLELNLTAKSRNDVKGVLSDVTSFICIIMSVVWYKVLAPIDFCNKVIQARDATLDVEVSNVSRLLNQISEIRSQWKALWNEAKLVTSNLEIEIKFSRGRSVANWKRSRFHDHTGPVSELTEMTEGDETPEEAHFRQSVFYPIIDSVTSGFTVRFSAAKTICKKFKFLWTYLSMASDDLEEESPRLAEEYSSDITKEIVTEIKQLKEVHEANFGRDQLRPLDLLNSLYQYKLENISPNICVSLRILLTIPAAVASAERSFSKLKLVKNYLRSIMSQDRLVDLARLSIESDIARKINFDNVITRFALKKAKKAPLNVIVK